MSSHEDPKVNDDFLKFPNDKHGQHVEVQATRGFTHDHLGMKFIFREGKLVVDVVAHLESMLVEFPFAFDGEKIAPNPSAADVFEPETGKYLGTKKREM